ncbi:MAG: hypothetical protein IH600_18070 [Bacteroidetes bacterium]|nr:hypothetical protein [Bacteroidota bacterium]
MRTAICFLTLNLLMSFVGFAQGWEWQNPKPHGQTVNDLVMMDRARGVAVCNNGFYMYTADAGRSWTTYRLGRNNLERIIEARDGSLIVIADKRQVYRSTDNAYSWELVYSAASEGGGAQSYDIVSTPGGVLIAMLTATHLVKSTDDGQTWERFIISDPQMSFQGVRSIAIQSNTVWYLASSRDIVRSTNAGISWDSVNEKYGASGLQRLVFIDSLYGYQLRDGQLLRSYDGGENWEGMDIFGFGTVIGVEAGPRLGSSVFCLSLGHYLVNASTDSGDTWNISLTETAFEDAYPNTMVFVDERTGFIAGDGGRIIRTEDGGQSWSIVHGIGYVGTVTDLLFTDSDFGIATTYSSTVLLTTDGGRRWNEAIPSQQHSCDAITASPSGTLFLIATTTNYDFDLLRSTDKGKSWSVLSRLPLQYSSNNPEMAQSILAISDQEVMVGATFGLLLRSSDGGVTWDRSQVQEGVSNPYSSGLDIFYFPPATYIYMQYNGVQLSIDGGQTWTGWLTPGARSIWETQFLTPDIGFGLISGEFSRTTDGGRSWETEQGFRPQLIHFFDATNGLAIWSDSEQDDLTYVMKTADAGRSWEKFSMGERVGYNGWFFLSPDRMWGYGYGGAIRYNGTGGIVSTDGAPFLPSSLTMDAGYPQPFSPATQQAFRIPFASSNGGTLRLALYDLLGREVAAIDRNNVLPGAQNVDLPGGMLRGLTPGTYLYRLTVGVENSTGRLVIR